jgi:succinate-semialdehyde dehydrogenase / glutarate-semialdehyde dehydrogenase
VNVVPSRRSGPLADALLSDARVRKLSFTGSTEVGRVLLASAARRVVNCSMELGGNAPFLVLADADLDLAVAGATLAKMRSSGATCVAANRFYVEAPVVDEFVDRMAASMGSMVMGAGVDPTTTVGPLVNRSERDRVAALVDAAIAEGATAVIGGVTPDRPGCYYPPTVLADVKPHASILGEEIFGPVAPIVSVGDVDEAIALANASEMGLISYAYTTDLAKGLRVAERLEAGMVALNRGFISDPAAPFGGVKQSGIGREGAHHGLLDYLEPKYVGTTW